MRKKSSYNIYNVHNKKETVKEKFYVLKQQRKWYLYRPDLLQLFTKNASSRETSRQVCDECP